LFSDADAKRQVPVSVVGPDVPDIAGFEVDEFEGSCAARKLGQSFDLEVCLRGSVVAGILARCLSRSVWVVGTLRREVLDQMLIFNEMHLSKILGEYAEHHNGHRPHQFRSQRPPAAETAAARPITGLADLRSIHRQPILNGLINQYQRAA
jgi:hypothetical protein